MIGLGIVDRSTALVAIAMRQDLRRFKSDIVPRLREAGNLVRRKEREMLKSTGIKLSKGSRLRSQHRVIVRWSDSAGSWEAFVGPTPGGLAFYGKFLELGAGTRTTEGGASRGALVARPWMKPAIEATENKVTEILAQTYRKFRIVGATPGGGHR